MLGGNFFEIFVTQTYPWFMWGPTRNLGPFWRLLDTNNNWQRFKGYRCESNMPLYEWKVAWNYASNPFKIFFYKNTSPQGGIFEEGVNEKLDI